MSERMSAADAALLHFVSERGFTHAASISVIEGDVPFDDYARDLELRVQALPRLRQVPAPVPFNLAYPTWEYDPAFRFADHVDHIHLDPPGTWEQLLSVASRLYSVRLDPHRPAWFAYLIGGLEGGRSAVLFKVHHAITDGVGAEEFQRVLYGEELPAPVGSPLDRAPAPPGPLKRIGSALRDDGKSIRRTVRRIPGNIVGLGRWLVSEEARRAVRVQRDYLRAEAVRFPFNVPCTGNVKIAATRFLLEDFRAIGRACDATVNDVLLAVVGRAVQSYAALHNIDTAGKSLKVQMPVNMRDESDPRNMGNIATVAQVPVPLDAAGPIDTLHAIARHTRALKQSRAPLAMHRLIGATLFLLTPLFAPLIQRSVASLKCQRRTFHASRKPGATFVLSNVPRRPVPLYVAGHRLSMRYAFGSPAPHIGIGCIAMTCGVHLGVTFSANAEGAADLDRLVALVEQAFEELSAATTTSPH